MKRIIRFSKFFLPAAVLSLVLIVLGLIGFFAKGFNLGVDFQAGVNQTVQLAIPVGEVSYSGKGNVEMRISDEAVVLVFSGAEVEQKTTTITFAANPTIADVAKALSAETGVEVSLEANQDSLASSLLVATYQGNTLLSRGKLTLHRVPANAAEQFASIDFVREAISSLGRVSVQSIRPTERQRFLIRVQDEGTDPHFTETVRSTLTKLLEEKFGQKRVVVLKTDFVGARYSEALSKSSAFLVAATLLLILLYSAIRFKIQYALGAVIAIAHDALIMVAFIVWTRMEFNATTIAAILTILGYSINDTIVQFDRIREERKLRPTDKFVDVVDSALTHTLWRTIITTATTMLAVLALFFFTTGSMRDFALALFVGMISGTYSTIFIASGFVDWWQRKVAKGNYKDKAPVAAPTEGEA
jgi:preprotein translocase subunit SecF